MHILNVAAGDKRRVGNKGLIYGRLLAVHTKNQGIDGNKSAIEKKT